MTNCEKLHEVFGDFMSEMNNMADFRKWLISEYVEKSKSVRRREDIQKEEPVQFDEEKNGQMSFLKAKDLYHFEGWANWYDEDGYLQVGRFDMHTQAKSEAQALNNIKARIKRQNGWPMNKKIDIDLNDGVSSLTKVFPPISEYYISYLDDGDITIVVKARNIREVYEKLQAHNIYFDDCDTNINIGEIGKN